MARLMLAVSAVVVLLLLLGVLGLVATSETQVNDRELGP